VGEVDEIEQQTSLIIVVLFFFTDKPHSAELSETPAFGKLSNLQRAVKREFTEFVFSPRIQSVIISVGAMSKLDAVAHCAAARTS